MASRRPPGQTYAQSLAKGGININDYISTGDNRKQFYGALAPRVGLSFDLLGDKATVLYAGYGRAYDRAMANYAMDELQRNLTTGDQFMIRNDYKAPYSDQFGAGLRQALGSWNGEVGMTYTHAKNQFNWFAGDRDPNGGWGNQGGLDRPELGCRPAGLRHADPGRLHLAAEDDPGLPARREALHARIRLAGRRHLHLQRRQDHQPRLDRRHLQLGLWQAGRRGGFNPSKLVEKHRIVATALADSLLPWDMTLSGKLTIGSGLPYRITTCPQSWDACQSFYGKADWTKQLDIAFSKGFKVPGGEFSLRLDVLNLFNTVNWNQYNDWGGGPGNPQNWTGRRQPRNRQAHGHLDGHAHLQAVGALPVLKYRV
jgi:hypothetical protein